MAERHEDQLRARLAQVKAEIVAINDEYQDQWIDPKSEDGEKFNALLGERELLAKTIDQREQRKALIAGIADEQVTAGTDFGHGGQFNIGAPMAEKDLFDLSTIRSSATNPGQMRGEMHDRARRVVDRMTFPKADADQAKCKESIERILCNADDAQGSIARRVLVTGSASYKEAFGRYIATGGQEMRADLNIGTGADGGFAVPVELDPTLIPTSSDVVNPFRSVSKVVQTTAKQWQGVTQPGVSAVRDGETAEVSDAGLTLSQPTATVNRASVFLPFSISLEASWQGMAGELAQVIQDAKDAEEVSSFTNGTGTIVPQGVLVGALASTIISSGTAALASVDLDSVENTLGPRFRQNAVWMGNRAVYNKIRHFDAAGGPDYWLALAGGMAQGGRLTLPIHGYPAYENSAMVSALTTANKILILGDFGRYFLIVDKIGLNIELVPHLFGTGSNFPTGQRGFLAYWFNTSQVLSASAFVILKTL